MPLSPNAQSFVPVIEAHRDALASLAVPALLILPRQSPRPEGSRVPFPKPERDCPACEGDLYTQAQFWAHGRLWRLQSCEDRSCPMVLDSAGPEDGLTEGQAVEGNSTWRLTPGVTVAPSGTVEWEHNAAIHDLAGFWREPEDEDGFTEALVHVLGGVAWEVDSHLGGAVRAIQWTPTPDPCPTCGQPLTFLGQLGPNGAEFYWSDAGRAYLFACLHHPEHTFVDCQTH
jgi:hypothetical protein